MTMPSVPFLDLKSAQLAREAELFEAVRRVLRSGRYVLGQEVAAFERQFAEYCETEHAVGVANGLDALFLILKALGIGQGDEVLVPSNTYIATWLAVTHVGATPVPVEPLGTTCNMDAKKLEAALSSRTRAVMPVHLYGQPADLDPILDFAEAHRLVVVEDAAQAHGARYKGRRIGGHGLAVGWSFYPGKNLGAIGDGGAITTNNAALAQRLRTLRNYGSPAKYYNEVIGWNSRLDELQAALLRVKLSHLDSENSSRALIAALYNAELAGLPDLVLPCVMDGVETVWHLYTVRHPRRDELARHLEERGISTMIHYPIPPHLQPAYAHLGITEGSQPIAEGMANRLLSLPMGPTMTLSEARAVSEGVRSYSASG